MPLCLAGDLSAWYRRDSTVFSPWRRPMPDNGLMAGGRPDIHHKALLINQDATRYGTFAEIGAGQEVARWFFHVGGASGTVAKTISAYDMAVSDAVYGATERYVSRARLLAMLDHEYELLLSRLDALRGAETKFFAFADTVATRSPSHLQDGRGWLGIRFQSNPRGEPSQIVIHARMWDLHSPRQQEALGILGVNLIHGAFFLEHRAADVVSALMDELTRDRMEVDMIEFSGPAFSEVDNRLISLQLVEQRLTNAVIFNSAGAVVEPAELLHDQPVLIERGSFRPVTRLTLDMQAGALEEMRRESGAAAEEPIVLMEMTIRNLLASGPAVDHSDFLARVNTLSVLGCSVMVSNYSRFHNVVVYLRRYTSRRIGLVLGVPTLVQLLSEKYYRDLGGGLLEALALLFQGPVQLYVYPWTNPSTAEVVTAENFQVPPHLRFLYAHLRENGLVTPLQRSRLADQEILPRDVLAWIQSGDPAWESQVPEAVVSEIKKKRLFGYAGAGHEIPRG